MGSLRWLEQVFGALLFALVLLDVFATVLYARANASIISDRLEQLTWRAFRGVSGVFGRQRELVLSICGPAILVVLVVVWASLLTLGAVLIIHPELGRSIRASDGETPTDFMSAIYAGGSSLAIVGASDFGPTTGPSRMFYLVASFVGVAGLSLTLSYLVQVYAGLQQRNTLGVSVQLLTAETGDAAELIANIGPEGEFSAGHSNLTTLAEQMTNVKEAHHFYSVLFYFRFRDPYYVVPRFTLVAFDTVTLIKTALDDTRYAWLKESASVGQLERASMLLVKRLEDAVFSGGVPGADDPPNQQARERWRRRYVAALRRLRQAGIQTTSDETAGAKAYAALRARWDHPIRALAPKMAYSIDDIDSAGSVPERCGRD